jgi:AbrB family looped-hinge helix DNA binding protein
MSTVLVSPKFQVVIPREIREQSNITVGQRLQMISFDDRIELVPVRKMKSTRGFLKGYDASFLRDEDDRV